MLIVVILCWQSDFKVGKILHISRFQNIEWIAVWQKNEHVLIIKTLNHVLRSVLMHGWLASVKCYDGNWKSCAMRYCTILGVFSWFGPWLSNDFPNKKGDMIKIFSRFFQPPGRKWEGKKVIFGWWYRTGDGLVTGHDAGGSKMIVNKHD